MIYYPPPGLRFALVLRLFVFTVSFLFVLPLCWLVIFIHLMSWRAAHRFVITPNLVVRKGLVAVVMYCTDYCGEAVRLRACVCVCVPRQETEKERVQILHAQDSCLPNAGSTAGQLFSVKGTNTEYALWIFDYHFLRRNKKSRWTPPWILIWSCFMVAQLHDWNRFSAQNSLVKVNYKGYWNDGRCHDCHYIFFSHSELRCRKMINECLFINWCVCRKEGSKMALHS